LELLKPHGRLAIVLPANKFSGQATSYIRKWLVQRAEILAVVALGRNTFLPHTHQKANILFARKRAAAALPADVQPIFFAVSERDGKNSRGVEVVRDPKASESWSRLDHDLEEIVAAYRSQVGSVI
jgi:type I restriction enzyme M protein